MISQQILKDISKLAYPGITIHYSELKDVKDKKTVSDVNGDITKAISTKNQKDINSIIISVYQGSKFKGELVDDRGTLRLVYEGKVTNLDVNNNGSVLKITDTVNKKTTIIEYKTSKSQEVKVSLQDQILTQLKKRKMNDKEVIDLIKRLEEGIK